MDLIPKTMLFLTLKAVQSLCNPGIHSNNSFFRDSRRGKNRWVSYKCFVYVHQMKASNPSMHIKGLVAFCRGGACAVLVAGAIETTLALIVEE